MRRNVRRSSELGALSPLTKNGQPVFSSMRIIQDLGNPHEQLIEEYTPDSSDAIKVLEFLDKINGLHWTPDLIRIERELRAALLDLITIDKKENI
jgi:hypothetical protein